MLKSLLATLALTAFSSLSAVEYKAVPNWYKLPPDRPQIGQQHGDVAVSSKGEVYVSTMDARAALQVYAADGKWLRNVPDAPNDFHGFVIRKDESGEHIYGPRLGAGNILKLTLGGKTVLDIPPTAIPDSFKRKGKDGNLGVRLTAMDVAPNGDLFVTDGYSSDYVHRFAKSGEYLKSFGGKDAPYSLKTLHKIAIDTRFNPPRIFGCDRENKRAVHISLEGEFLGVVAEELLRPAAVAIHADHAIVGEIGGRVTILDKAGKVVAHLGTNTTPGETATNRVEPDKWRTGIVNAPHGVACDANGNIYVSEYSLFGRVHRFNRE